MLDPESGDPTSDNLPVRILFVEDNDAHAELVLRCMSDQGIRNEVIHVGDGERAIEYLTGITDAGDYPDLILLDLRLPRIDGMEVLRIVKSSDDWKHIPVVILTTSSENHEVGRAYTCGANSYLVKPVDFRSFSQMMNDVGSYWLVWNRGTGISR